MFCPPVKISFSPAENINETPGVPFYFSSFVVEEKKLCKRLHHIVERDAIFRETFLVICSEMVRTMEHDISCRKSNYKDVF